MTLIGALLLRITVAHVPFAGWSVWLGAASGALAGFAVWILASAAWSHAPARAITEFDRALLYLLVLTLTGSVAGRRGDLAVLLRWSACYPSGSRSRSPTGTPWASPARSAACCSCI
jgi:hypothetical protein